MLFRSTVRKKTKGQEDEKLPFDYARDNMERRPYEFYIEEYRQADPMEISNRLGIAYDVQKSEFIIFFMGVNYHVSYPDFRVSHEESEMCFYPLEEIQHIQSGHMHNQVLEDFLLMLIIWKVHWTANSSGRSR